MGGRAQNILQVDIKSLTTEDLLQHIKTLSTQFRRASNRVTAAEQVIDRNTKKLENGGRNAQQTTERIDQARRDLESARAEYRTVQTSLQEAQGHLEAVMDASRSPSPLSDIPADDGDEDRGHSPLSDIPLGAGLAESVDPEVMASSTASTLSEGEAARFDYPNVAFVPPMIGEESVGSSSIGIASIEVPERRQESLDKAGDTVEDPVKDPVSINEHTPEKSSSPAKPHSQTSPAASSSSMGKHPQSSSAAMMASNMMKGKSSTAPAQSFRRTGISQTIREFQKILAQPASEIIAKQQQNIQFSNGNVLYRMSEDKSAGSSENLAGEGSTSGKKLDEDKLERPNPLEGIMSSEEVVQPVKELKDKGKGKRRGRTNGDEDSDAPEGNENSEADEEARPPKKKVKSNKDNKDDEDDEEARPPKKKVKSDKDNKDDEGTFSAEKEAQILKEVGTKRADETLAQYDRRRATSKTVKKLAREQIDAFNRKPLLTNLSPAVRKLCRSIAEFMPETGTSHRLLSLAVLTTTHGNIRCPFHAVNDHRVRFFDGDGGKGTKRAWAITGVGMPPTKGGKKGKQISPPEGYLHCGCDIETVLLDFYFWKSGTIRSTSGAVEPWYETLHPRTRGLFYGDWKKKTGMVLENLWRLKQDPHSKMFNIEVTERDIIKAQIHSLQQQLLGLKERAEAKRPVRKMDLYIEVTDDEDSQVEEKAAGQPSSDQTKSPVAAVVRLELP